MEYTELISKMRETLNTFNNRIDDTDVAIKTQLCERDSSASAIRSKYDEQKNKIQEDIRYAEANQSYAVKNNAIVQRITLIEEYKKLDLLKLSTRISNRDAKTAQELYDRSSAMLNWLNNKLASLENQKNAELKENEKLFDANISRLKSSKQIIIEDARTYASQGEEPKEIRRIHSLSQKRFASSGSSTSDGVKKIAIGTVLISFPAIPYVREYSDNCIDFEHGTLSTYINIDFMSQRVIFAEYTSQTERDILSAFTNLIFNAVRYNSGYYTAIHFIDAIHFNGYGLGALAQISGRDDSIICKVPKTPKETESAIRDVLEECLNNSNARQPQILWIHKDSSPLEGESAAFLKQLCANAELYSLNIIVTCRKSNTDEPARSLAAEMPVHNHLLLLADGSVLINGQVTYNLSSLLMAPDILPENALLPFKKAEKEVLTNSYRDNVGYEPTWKKGSRVIPPIPYGINHNGDILALDFENTNFATFICGASRSGKSTLLHTLLTGVFRAMHPDDIEVWLIDFKMTEFSRYIKHRPPHVRYIVLDESPELVYDIVNRLHDILLKRQNMFMGNWDKLYDVPITKYMPSMLIVIDEFSIMSEIIAESIEKTSENYINKMQRLLVKGAAVGMHFIFASQGFTSGTRGLSDLSKSQIQQRIAMKTSYEEIIDTLSVKDASDHDRRLMDELEKYHALVRIPINEDKNQLLYSKVLYLDDNTEQLAMIDRINNYLHAVDVFDPYAEDCYIDKQSLVVDGNTYRSFDSKIPAFYDWVCCHEEELADADEHAYFVGDPLKLIPIAPIRLTHALRENILIIAPPSERDTAASLLLSLNGCTYWYDDTAESEIWSSEKDRTLKRLAGRDTKEYIGLSQCCKRIHEMKKTIEEKKICEKLIFLLGFESLFGDMKFCRSEILEHDKISDAVKIKDREPGALDLQQIMAMGRNGEDISTFMQRSPIQKISLEKTLSEESLDAYEYDAREDLRFMLVNGPRYGYHFVLVTSTVGDLAQMTTSTGWSVDHELFRHKFLFRASRNEMAEIVGYFGAVKIADLPNRLLIYTDGLVTLSLRPYLHDKLSWDNWHIDNEGKAVKETKEEYLL